MVWPHGRNKRLAKDFDHRKDEILSETGKMIQGQFEGTVGQVVEATDTHEKVEPHSKIKMAVGKNQVKVVGDNTGAFSRINFRSTPGHVPATPFLTMQTPMHGSQTTPEFATRAL